MKILFVNKFLYHNGGSETYCFKLAEHLQKMGHDVQFFGMEHQSNVVGNDLKLNVSNTEFKQINFKKLMYPFKIVYSLEAKQKIKKLIEYFKPDIIHLNNYNFQITPSILYEIKKYKIPVIMTLHDFQIVCPNHMMYIEHLNHVCEACRGRKYFNCISNKCIHNSRVKSILAAVEAIIYYKLKTYEKYIDLYISPSNFLRDKICEFGESENKIVVMHNFSDVEYCMSKPEKADYVLYFGRLSIQKGIRTFIEACRKLPNINFVVAGTGELQDQLKGVTNLNYVGFKKGNELKELISKALFSVYPSEWYENGPLSILESQMYGTPVIGAQIGGIPELIKNDEDGYLFEPGNVNGLVEKINFLYCNRGILNTFSENCLKKAQLFSINNYSNELLTIYKTTIEKHRNVR